MVEKSLIELPEVFLNQAFRLYDRLGFKLDQHHLNRGYPGPLHFLLEAQKRKQAGRKQVKNGYAEDTLALIESIVPYTTEMGDGRWKSVDNFAKELVMSLLSNEQIDKFYVVHGAAGTGKSVYLATLFEAIKYEMCSNHQLNPLDEINRFSLPLFHSNLKHVSGYGELDAKLVLDGIGADLFPTHEIWSPTKLAEMADIPETLTGLPRGIILIDSLDEYITNTAKSSAMTYDSIRESLFKTHADFVDAGFIPVWSCRTREYHLLEMVEEKKWEVKASTPPALETTNLAEYCFCEKENEGILGEIRRYSDPNTRENSEVSSLLRWLLKIASVNPLFFFFKTFTENRDEAKKLMHDLIHRMQEAFEDVEQHILYDEKSVMELQNQFVLSDFVLQTILEHLYSTYNTKPYDLKNQMQEVIQALQHWVDNWGGARDENLEDLTEVWESLGKEANQIEEIVDFQVLEYYGLIAKTEVGKWIWRHRSFAEYLCVSDSLGAYTRGERIDEIEEKWGEQDFNRSVWRWRKWGGNWGASGTIIRDRTGAYATFFPSEMFSHVQIYLDLFLDTDDLIDRQRLAQGKFGFSQTQLDIVERGVERNEAIVLKGWPGTGKTYTGTHMLLGRLVNAHLRSGRAEYDSEQASKGLIITLNPKLSVYLKEELDQYEKGPWSVLADNRIAWYELKKSVDVLSMEEIVARLDDFESSNARSRGSWLKDLKEIHDNHWKRFVHSCKNLPEWEYDPTYDWKKASQEFQECFLDEMGAFYPNYGSVRPIHGGKVSEQWFEYVKRIFNPNNSDDIHPIPLKTACIKLVHRFIQAFDYHGPTEELPDTKMRDADHRTNEQILESLRSNPLVSYFSNALIDEVQDLPVEACLLISLLVHKGAGNQRSRVLFAGDEFQVLNQSNFEWSKFGRLYQQKITELQNQYERNHINAESYLYQTASPNVGDEPFTDNWRNTSDIVETWKKAGSWSPEGLKITPLEGIEKAYCIRTQEDDSNHSVSLITYDSTSRSSFDELIGSVDEVIKNHSGVAFISMADQLDSTLRKKEVEHYTPFTIKGLERNNAVVVGSLLFEKNKSFTESDVKDERMRLIVGLSRAKNSMVLLLPSNSESKKHMIRIEGKEYEQHDLSHLLGRQVRIIRAKDLKEVRLEIEKIVGGDDEGRAILAIDEYLAAEAYGSDQIESIGRRVRKICETDIHEENELSYFWQILQQLNFSHYMNPVFLEVFILKADPQSYLKGLSKVPLDGTQIANTLHRYHSKWIHGNEDPYYKILQRHDLFTAFEHTIQEMIDLSPPVISGIEGAYDLTFNRIQSRIIDGLKHLRGQMDFLNYLWDEKNGFVKDSKQLALLHYLVKDYDEINKFNPASNQDEIVYKNASTLLKMIGGVASKEYARFRTLQKNSIPELKRAIGSVLSFVALVRPSASKPIENFLSNFPAGEYRNILSTQALVSLIRFIIDSKHPQRRISYNKQLSHLFIAFCSPGHQVESVSASRRESLSRREFTLVYGLLGQREKQGISSKNLNFDYAQHVLSEQFLDQGLNPSLVEYSTRLDRLFKLSVIESTLMQPKLNIEERMPSETLTPTGAAKQSEPLSKVIHRFIADILDALDDPINGQMYNQNGTIQMQLGVIAYTLLKYNADAYLKDVYVNQLQVDTDFTNTIERLRKKKKISMDEMVNELINEMNDYLTRDVAYAEKHLLIMWASVRYIIDVLEHQPTPEAMTELRDISRRYPFFKLDDKNERPLVGINSDGSFLIPPWNDFQQKTKQLTTQMKARRENFTYFARSPYAPYRITPRSYLSSPVYLKESMAEWCKISWDEYAKIANTSEDVEFNGMPVLIHQSSLALLPELLSKIRKEALASIRKVKTRVRVETIVKSVRKTKPYDTTVPFGRGIDSKINNARNSEAYKKMFREIENQVEQEIVLGTGKARKQQEAERKALRDSLIQLREPYIIVDELWRAAVKDVLTNSFNLKINVNPDNKTTFIDVIENEDAIEKLEKGV